MWIDYFNGMVLEKGDIVKATAYSERKLTDCRILSYKDGFYDAEDINVTTKDSTKLKIRLTDKMIVKVYRYEY